jgi:hypothetical protein
MITSNTISPNGYEVKISSRDYYDKQLVIWMNLKWIGSRGKGGE